jgi:hypothetical protein
MDERYNPKEPSLEHWDVPIGRGRGPKADNARIEHAIKQLHVINERLSQSGNRINGIAEMLFGPEPTPASDPRRKGDGQAGAIAQMEWVLQNLSETLDGLETGITRLERL